MTQPVAQPAARQPAAPAVGQVSCSLASTLLRDVRARAGEQGVRDVLRRAGLPHTAEHLDDPANWIWASEAAALLDAAADALGDERIGRRVGEQTVRQHAGTPVATLLRSLGSAEAVYEQLSVAVGKFSTITELATEVEPGRAVVRARSRGGFDRHPRMCDWTRGLLSQPPVLFGLPAAQVEETLCQARGHDHCLYTATWDAERAAAAADPAQLVTALESQLVAMGERLENVYATARDLIACDDLDAALARITERAATAVRAPSYLLAVQADDGLRVHHRGYVDSDVDAAARALLAAADAEGAGDRLVVEVASATRQYGRLMAASPTGAFFPHERDLLAVYARYAAAVLDTATAFAEARLRERQSRALLELSRAVAAAATSDEVALRLVEAVPAVVDCDRVSVFLWDDSERVLVCRAMTGHGELVRDLAVRPADTPALARLVADPTPDPLFFEPSMADPFTATMLRETGSRALTVVPIVTHDRFYGTLHVSVADRPERLRASADLLDVLAGVVGHTATALANARLIQTMADLARFDSLTGALGHRAFHEALDAELARGAAFTLASVDVDDFKQINDRHGHPVGDEALRRVAGALRGGAAEHGALFRVGGEELAVILPGLTGADARAVGESLRAAVAATDFDPPLRVSVGLASWPHDARSRDALLERADDALYAAKRMGKDRVVAAGDEVALMRSAARRR